MTHNPYILKIHYDYSGAYFTKPSDQHSAQETYKEKSMRILLWCKMPSIALFLMAPYRCFGKSFVLASNFRDGFELVMCETFC